MILKDTFSCEHVDGHHILLRGAKLADAITDGRVIRVFADPAIMPRLALERYGIQEKKATSFMLGKDDNNAEQMLSSLNVVGSVSKWIGNWLACEFVGGEVHENKEVCAKSTPNGACTKEKGHKARCKHEKPE